VIPSPSSSSSGEPDLPKVTESSPSDWRADLLEAVQQRDVPVATMLAQRCVHRYGIGVLESLLESVSPPEGDDSDARAWLLSLLLQPPPLQPSTPPPTPAPSVAAEVNLDEAFAPLEIAFPPLPTAVEDPTPRLDELQTAQLESEHPQTDPPPLVSLAGTEELLSLLHDDPPDEWRSESVSALQVSPEPSDAAPIPRFDGDGVSEQRSFALPKERRHGKRAFSRPAPISPDLEPWVSWLHDGTSSRPGS
jgi:hypothetical protein